MATFNVRCDRRYAPKRDGVKSKIKKNKGGVGQAHDKMLSVDGRPSLRKRPRLDVDPNGLDPFGLDALLGLINNINNSDHNVSKGSDKGISTTEGCTKEGPASQSLTVEGVMASKSVQDDTSKIQLEVNNNQPTASHSQPQVAGRWYKNNQSTVSHDQTQVSGSLEVQEQLQVDDDNQSSSAKEGGDINIEVDNTIVLGAKMGVQLCRS
ncbi:hypothetical protein Hanom_Chr06g00517541 [Helianthus anomalus]